MNPVTCNTTSRQNTRMHDECYHTIILPLEHENMYPIIEGVKALLLEDNALAITPDRSRTVN